MTHAQHAKPGAPSVFAPVKLLISDPHGEYEEFSHILRGACGRVRRAVDEAFPDLPQSDRACLASLVCYPRERTARLLDGVGVKERPALLASLIAQLTTLLSRYAQERAAGEVAAASPGALTATVEELLEGRLSAEEAAQLPQAVDLICALARAIQLLAVERLYLLGDVFDRGPSPDLILDEVASFPEARITWGNHDIVWMGAALGQPGCVCHVVRICARYGNLSVLTDTYGMDLSPLFDFAMSAYADDPCTAFGLKGSPDLSPADLERTIKVQKAMAIIQFKAEARLIDENPSFGLADRKLLGAIDFDRGTVAVDSAAYELTDTVFPTVDPSDPYRLTPEEEAVLHALEQAFIGCDKLQRHVRSLLDRGSLYLVAGDDLLFHACVPLNPDGSLKEVALFGQTYRGKALFDAVDGYVRDAFAATDPEARKRGADLLWYLWLGQGSPLFAKSKMATFEIYDIADKAARKEVKNPFYQLYEDPEVLAEIFRDFGMDPERSRIVCGHVPVKAKDGEDPVKAGGKLLIIDGGMSKPYREKSGIAGYTLVEDADGAVLYAHQDFSGRKAAIEECADLFSTARVLD